MKGAAAPCLMPDVTMPVKRMVMPREHWCDSALFISGVGSSASEPGAVVAQQD